jgi:Peptidase family M28/PA domain
MDEGSGDLSVSLAEKNRPGDDARERNGARWGRGDHRPIVARRLLQFAPEGVTHLNARAAAAIFLAAFVHPRSGSAATPETCGGRANDTVARITECIEGPALQQRLADFQTISDSHGGNRDSGDPGGGYEASAQYVADRMTAAGYRVTIQTFPFAYFKVVRPPALEELSPSARAFSPAADFGLIDFSGSGDVKAQVQPAGGIVLPPTPDPSSSSGCDPSDFRGFVPGNIALIQRGACSLSIKAANAAAAGAAAAIIFNEGNPGRTENYGATLASPSSIPVLSASFAVGVRLANVTFFPICAADSGPAAGRPCRGKADRPTGPPAVVHVAAETINENRLSENVLAETPAGDETRVLVIGAHLDSLYGAGILDNASGSAAILEIALQMRNVAPANRVRFAWWGAEEEGIAGSDYYLAHLDEAEQSRIFFYLDADVIATPNFYINVLDPSQSPLAETWPRGAVRASEAATRLFGSYFDSVGSPYITIDKDDLPRSDTLPFLNAGLPVGGVFTGQGDFKSQEEVDLFGGFVGLTESCADEPTGCDDLGNVNPVAFELVSKAYAAVAIQMAFDAGP